MNVLSIQSHVSFGHAGNSASVFVLQYLGINVWPVHTVNFSNHTGYGKWKGMVFDGKSISEIVSGIFDIVPYTSCTALLTGYLGSESIAGALESIVSDLKKQHPDTLYFCDPVMGDTGRGIFVKETIPPFLRRIITLSDFATPNHFEFNMLCGESRNYKEAVSNAGKLLKAGVKWVIIKSFIGDETEPGTLDILAVSAQGGAYKVSTPRILYQKESPPPVGTGDLFTSLYLGHYLKNGRDPIRALETACSSIYSILLTTKEHQSYELQIIEAREQISIPGSVFKAVTL